MTKEMRLETIAQTVPRGVLHLLTWTMSTITICKQVNPMVFMTKDYFVARVSRPEETLAVQELIEHIENWRYCKMIEFHGQSSE